MEIIDAGNIDIRNYCGDVIITYAQDDSEKCAELFEKLDAQGVQFIKNALSESTVQNGNYITDMNEQMKTCSCYVLVLTDGLFNSDELCRVVWYQVGYMQSVNSFHILVYRIDNIDLSKSPISGINEITGDLNLRNNNNFKNEILAYPFDAKQLTDVKPHYKYIIDHLIFRRFVVRFSTPRKKYDEVARHFSTHLYREFDINDFINRHVSIKTKIFEFGNDRAATDPQLLIYGDERCVGENIEFPIGFEGNRTAVVDEEQVTFDIEIIVPVHKVLGAKVKPFLEIKGGENLPYVKKVFEKLFRGSLDCGEFYNENERRIYFSLPFVQEDCICKLSEEQAACYGEEVNYIFPQ